MIKLSVHARRQAERRGFDPSRSENQVNSIADEVKRLGKNVPDSHVYVILCKYKKEIKRRGCRGDNLIACVDVSSSKITTVMLQTTQQIIRNVNLGWVYVEA